MSATHFSGPLNVGSGRIETITAGKTLTYKEDNGKTFILGDAAPGTITLPPVATSAGFFCKVICGFAITSDGVVAATEAGTLEGAIMVASTVVTVAADDQMNFVDTAENIGDWVSFECDGTYWYVDGRALSTGAITAT